MVLSICLWSQNVAGVALWKCPTPDFLLSLNIGVNRAVAWHCWPFEAHNSNFWSDCGFIVTSWERRQICLCSGTKLFGAEWTLCPWRQVKQKLFGKIKHLLAACVWHHPLWTCFSIRFEAEHFSKKPLAILQIIRLTNRDQKMCAWNRVNILISLNGVTQQISTITPGGNYLSTSIHLPPKHFISDIIRKGIKHWCWAYNTHTVLWWQPLVCMYW